METQNQALTPARFNQTVKPVEALVWEMLDDEIYCQN